MKKLILVLMILLPLIAHSQVILIDLNTYEIGKSKYVYENDKFLTKLVWDEKQDIELLLVLDLSNEFIKISNVAETYYKITPTPNIEPGKVADSEGDMTTIYKFDAVGKDDVKSKISYRTWDQYNIIQIYIYTGDQVILWSGKNRATKI